jgi:ATP-binding cassette subfamily B (MDR/TAP) protein 8
MLLFLQSTLEAVNRLAIHISLLVLYALGGWLISNGYMSLKTLMAGIGFTFSLIFASQGVVNTLSEWRAVEGAVSRFALILSCASKPPVKGLQQFICFYLFLYTSLAICLRAGRWRGVLRVSHT